MLFEESLVKKVLKTSINIFTLFFFSFSFILTGVVAISQNALPGDRMYGVKTNFEKAVLAGCKILNLDTRYQIDLTELRFQEVKKIIKSDNAVLGLNSLFKQIMTTESSIYNIKSPKKKSDMANQYISTLTNISYQLEQEKTVEAISKPVNIIKRTPTLIPTIGQPSNSGTTASTPQTTVNNQISLTQQQIQEIIDRLNTVTTEEQTSPQLPVISNVTQAPTVEPSPTLIPTIAEPSTKSKTAGEDQPEAVTQPTNSPAPEPTTQPTSEPTIAPTTAPVTP